MRIKLFNKKKKKYIDKFFNIDEKGNPFEMWACGDNLEVTNISKRKYEIHYFPGKKDIIK